MTESVFREKAPGIMALLCRDFDLTIGQAAAVMGNAGHESGGLTAFQEIKPTVKGSRGGFGWFQWTGARRRAFEAYCARNGFDPRSDIANYKFLFVELTGAEKGALRKLRSPEPVKGKTLLYAQTKAFELGFERAGAKHYDKRYKWAQIALDAYSKAGPNVPVPSWAGKPEPFMQPDDPGPVAKPEPKGGGGWVWWLLAGLAVAAIAVALWGM